MELFDSNLTGTKIIIPFENTENTNSSIPLEYSRVDFVGWVRIISYIIVFTISGAGNLWELNSVLRRSKIRRAPVNRLLLHLCIADIIVVLMVAGVEILWRISISWQAGEFLCKVVQFFRGFGLYLSSLVLICISLDRYYAVVHPLKVVTAPRRVTIMLSSSWLMATLCSVPQAIIFREERHPEFPKFVQCTSMRLPEGERLNTWLSLTVMYYIPLAVIIFSYCSILHKVTTEISTTQKPGSEQLVLRRNGHSVFKKAKLKTIKLTFMVVFMYILCWTPYVVITTWYMVDPKSAEQIDGNVQEGLFLMIVANSSSNPLVYGLFNKLCTQKPVHANECSVASSRGHTGLVIHRNVHYNTVRGGRTTQCDLNSSRLVNSHASYADTNV